MKTMIYILCLVLILTGCKKTTTTSGPLPVVESNIAGKWTLSDVALSSSHYSQSMGVPSVGGTVKTFVYKNNMLAGKLVEVYDGITYENYQADTFYIHQELWDIHADGTYKLSEHISFPSGVSDTMASDGVWQLANNNILQLDINRGMLLDDIASEIGRSPSTMGVLRVSSLTDHQMVLSKQANDTTRTSLQYDADSYNVVLTFTK